MDRRDLLKTLPAVAVGLAGCAGGQGTPEPTESPTPEPTGTAMPTGEQTGTDAATDTPMGTRTGQTDTTPTVASTDTPEPTPAPDVEVTVGPGGNLRFEPDDFTISAGDTVLWTWDSGGHNVKFDEGNVPAGTDWQGTPDSRTTTYGSGYTHSHTFTTTGTYEYYCVPHRSTGMTGAFTVE